MGWRLELLRLKPANTSTSQLPMSTLSPQGFLNLRKPAGWTSHDCVSKVRRVMQTRQVGHGGTLDPDATGVLPIAVGRATRFLQFLPTGKTYLATFRFGQTSTTDDATGDITQSQPAPELTLADIEAISPHFIGTIQQVPPVYSAIRKQGRRLYELARAGATLESLDIDPRPVDIYRLDALDWRSQDYPELDLEIACGPGTYIRALARDMGLKLGCGGLMSRLHRTQSGAFADASSVALETLLESESPQRYLQPIAAAFTHLPAITLDAEMARRWCCGQKLAHPEPTLAGPVRVLRAGDKECEFLGLAQLQEGLLKALRILASQG